jgi:hypothetical protein
LARHQHPPKERRDADDDEAAGMEVIAWSQNLSQEAAIACGARRVERGELFRLADMLTIHLVHGEAAEDIAAFLSGRPVRLLTPADVSPPRSRGSTRD